MDLGLKGKVAMVAGASKGLGYAVARCLAAEGVLVSMSSRDEGAINEAAKRISAETYLETLPMAVDVRDGAAIAAWHAKTMEKFGGVDLLFTNSGGPPAGTALSFDDDAWKAAFELLVLSAVRMVRLAVPSMKARGGGAIVVSTSTAVVEPVPNLALSNCVRTSVGALSKTLANELAADKIRVNHLMPGRIDTDRVRSWTPSARKRRAARPTRSGRLGLMIPLGRYGLAENTATPPCSCFPTRRAITGASLQCDGGLIKSTF
jgi:3-oxoacyl-[acyl-carrier protein] reductase